MNQLSLKFSLMNTYYYVGTNDEVTAIIRDGFIDSVKLTPGGIPACLADCPGESDHLGGRRGVYVGDAPREPDPDYPDDQLLEITLPAEIDCSQWRLVVPEDLGAASWWAWLIPVHILNQYGRIRPLRKDQWEFLWAKYNEAGKRQLKRLMNPDYLDKVLDEMLQAKVADGSLTIVRDAQGRPILRDGKIIYRPTEKARNPGLSTDPDSGE
jgi:hypothetical protein